MENLTKEQKYTIAKFYKLYMECGATRRRS